jgi:Acetyltransferase (GNAT) family
MAETDWSRDLLESDRRYFEAGAEILAFPGAQIARLRGSEALAAGCVVQRIDPKRDAENADAWLADLEARLRTFGTPRSRIYLESPEPALEAALRARDYRPRTEHGFVRAAESGAGTGEIALEAAGDEAGWRTRRELLRGQVLGVDGHAMDPDLWITMERRKHEAGYLRPYLIRADGKTVGAVCAAACGSLLRLKNLMVDLAHRRRGIATATAIAFARLAAEEGLAAAGCFALEGEPGLILYPKAGYRESATQTEWVRDLS